MQIHAGIFTLGFGGNAVSRFRGNVWANALVGIPKGDNSINVGWLPASAVQGSKRCQSDIGCSVITTENGHVVHR